MKRMGEDVPPDNKKHEDDDRTMENRIRDLEAALASTRAGSPLNLIPENSAGPGSEIAPTWSQADQEAANRA